MRILSMSYSLNFKCNVKSICSDVIYVKIFYIYNFAISFYKVTSNIQTHIINYYSLHFHTMYKKFIFQAYLC